MIRLAVPGDIDAVVRIAEDAKAIMQASGNFQWDENYPLKEDFEKDINEGSLYIIEQNGEQAGFMCVNGDEPEEYAAAAWTKPGKALILHRMAVSPRFRGMGFAGKLIAFAWSLTKELGAHSLRTDTFSGNIPMNSLFIKHGFTKTGEIELPFKKLQPFYCYEKL